MWNILPCQGVRVVDADNIWSRSILILKAGQWSIIINARNTNKHSKVNCFQNIQRLVLLHLHSQTPSDISWWVIIYLYCQTHKTVSVMSTNIETLQSATILAKTTLFIWWRSVTLNISYNTFEYTCLINTTVFALATKRSFSPEAIMSQIK